MKAMVLAAGLGTRLRPLTNDRPKALVELEGVTLLERVLRRLADAGVDAAIINQHHFAEQLTAWVRERGPAVGMPLALSHEETLLDTGGGLKQASWFFDDGQPFLVHNVDVLSDIDLRAMLAWHRETGALATLAVQNRPTSRRLLTDQTGRLCGRRRADEDEWAGRPAGAVEAVGFCGIHVVSPAIFPLLTESGAFSIIDAYLRLAAAGQPILAFRADGARWRDVGRLSELKPL